MYINKKTMGIIFLVAAVVLAVVGYLVLPDVVAVQFSFGGKVSNVLPKPVALGISFLITVIGAISCLRSREADPLKGLALPAVGILSYVLIFVFNLFR